jgi:hypothetical protein
MEAGYWQFVQIAIWRMTASPISTVNKAVRIFREIVRAERLAPQPPVASPTGDIEGD